MNILRIITKRCLEAGKVSIQSLFKVYAERWSNIVTCCFSQMLVVSKRMLQNCCQIDEDQLIFLTQIPAQFSVQLQVQFDIIHIYLQKYFDEINEIFEQ